MREQSLKKLDFYRSNDLFKLRLKFQVLWAPLFWKFENIYIYIEVRNLFSVNLAVLKVLTYWAKIYRYWNMSIDLAHSFLHDKKTLAMFPSRTHNFQNNFKNDFWNLFGFHSSVILKLEYKCGWIFEYSVKFERELLKVYAQSTLHHAQISL